MNLYDLMISFFMFMISMFMFSYFYKHLLLMIISLEFLMISIIYSMYLLIMYSLSINMVLFFLVISVCDSALALSLIVMIVRFQGNDYMNSLSLVKW